MQGQQVIELADWAHHAPKHLSNDILLVGWGRHCPPHSSVNMKPQSSIALGAGPHLPKFCPPPSPLCATPLASVPAVTPVPALLLP